MVLYAPAEMRKVLAAIRLKPLILFKRIKQAQYRLAYL